MLTNMDKPQIYIAVMVIITLILIFTTGNNIYYDLISGFYEADSSFCKESGIDVFSIYIDYESCNNRAGYILMMKDNEFIINSPITAYINMHIFNWNNWFNDPNTPKTFTITFEGLESFDEDIFPNKQILEYHPLTGKIVLFDGDTITAVMYKNGINSEIKSLDFE